MWASYYEERIIYLPDRANVQWIYVKSKNKLCRWVISEEKVYDPIIDRNGNYTDNCILHFEHDYEWYEAFDEVNRNVYVEIDDVEYTVEINFWRDSFEVYNGALDYLFDVYSYGREEVIEEIKDKLAENKEWLLCQTKIRTRDKRKNKIIDAELFGIVPL